MPTNDERGIVSKSKLTALAAKIKAAAGESGSFTLDELAALDISGGGGGETIMLSAAFDAGENKIFTTDSLDDLKQYLTVTATVDITPYVLADDAYTLSGSLAAGSNTITVSALGHTATFTVSGVIAATDISPALSTFTNTNQVAYIVRGNELLVNASGSSSYKCLQTASLISREAGYRYRLTMDIDYFAGSYRIGLRNSANNMVIASSTKQGSGRCIVDGLLESTQTLRVAIFPAYGSSGDGVDVLSNIKLIQYQEVS